MEETRKSPTALSVVVPTYNERSNIPEIVSRLNKSLGGIPWEVIFVDDASPDGTAEVVRDFAARDPRVRLIMRHNRRGLSSAVVEGALAASADVVAVMDGDLQHDESILVQLYETVASGQADIASASRFLLEDGAGGLSSETRLKISSSGISLANWMFNLRLTDPLTGFFAIRRKVVESALPDLSEVGFKVLLDLITAAHPAPKIVEVPFRFRKRIHGESKLDNRVMYDFFIFILEKKIAPIVRLPSRFISFSLVNSFGVLIHLLVLAIGLNLVRLDFVAAQLGATVFAMAFNYTANNLITYSDRRLKGVRFYIGFFIFALLSSVGVIANVGVSSMLHQRFESLVYLAPAALGALITVVWNYVASQAFVWGRTRYGYFARQRSRLVRRAKSRPTMGAWSEIDPDKTRRIS